MVAILLEPSYADSVWGRNLLHSLTRQLRQKRIPFAQITDRCPREFETVFVIAANYSWTQSAIKQLNRAGHRPVLLCNQSERLPGCLYSCVCSDVSASMKDLLALLKRQSCSRVALYGVGSSSIGDQSRANSLIGWLDDSIQTEAVFYNEGSLKCCFDAFFTQRDAFDAVICANDYAAISLVRRLRQLDSGCLSRLTVVSCAGTRISGCYRKYITSVPMDFTPFGKAALYVYECIRKNPEIAGMTVSVRWTQEEGQNPGEIALKLPPQTDAFYADPEIRELLIVDKYLNVADPADQKIFQLLLQKKTYPAIADACFMTDSTVKYRIKRIVQQCNAENREQLLGLLARYLEE